MERHGAMGREDESQREDAFFHGFLPTMVSRGMIRFPRAPVNGAGQQSLDEIN
jgi:hypothetical protein